MKDVIFLDHRTGKQLKDMPAQWPEEDLVAGHRIHKHTIGRGWRCLNVTRVNEGREPIQVFVKKALW